MHADQWEANVTNELRGVNNPSDDVLGWALRKACNSSLNWSLSGY